MNFMMLLLSAAFFALNSISELIASINQLIVIMIQTVPG